MLLNVRGNTLDFTSVLLSGGEGAPSNFLEINVSKKKLSFYIIFFIFI